MGANFDGTANINNLDLAATVPHTQQIILHFWFNPTNPNSSLQYVYNNTASFGFARLNTNNRLLIRIKDSAGLNTIDLSPSFVFTNLTGWTAVDVVADLTSGFSKAYYNGVEQLSATPAAGIDISHGVNDYVVGSGNAALADPLQGDIHQFSIWSSFLNEYVSATGELTAKYMTEMYDLDENGTIYPKQTSLAAALGSQPIILLEDDFATFEVNNGSEADFPAKAGALLDVSTPIPYGGWAFTPPA